MTGPIPLDHYSHYYSSEPGVGLEDGDRLDSDDRGVGRRKLFLVVPTERKITSHCLTGIVCGGSGWRHYCGVCVQQCVCGSSVCGCVMAWLACGMGCVWLVAVA